MPSASAVPSLPTSTTCYSCLPSYEVATSTKDMYKLPSYRKASSVRFHPYRRPTGPDLEDGTGIDHFYNTIYDEERIDVVPPPPLRHGPPPARALVPGPLLDPRLYPGGFFGMGGPPNEILFAHGYPHMRGAGGEDFDGRFPVVAAAVLHEFMAGLRRLDEAR